MNVLPVFFLFSRFRHSVTRHNIEQCFPFALGTRTIRGIPVFAPAIISYGNADTFSGATFESRRSFRPPPGHRLGNTDVVITRRDRSSVRPSAWLADRSSRSHGDDDDDDGGLKYIISHDESRADQTHARTHAREVYNGSQ